MKCDFAVFISDKFVKLFNIQMLLVLHLSNPIDTPPMETVNWASLF